MGSLILCHKKKAKHPYEIARIHMHIYTIEELCYYFCNNLYLVDYTIVNRKLCDWLDDELELYELAAQLRSQLEQNASIEQFLLTILSHASIYSAAEITKIHNVLEHLKNQNEVEREKYKADNLLNSGENASAILVYQSIVNKEWDDSIGKEFYGRVYGCLGAAYGRMFLYEEAAHMYEKAFEICRKPDMLRAYLYCCYRYLPEAEYVKMLSREPVYLSLDAEFKEELKKAREQMDLDITEETYEQWKREYRRADK
ncbi:MAG: hypothetical protein Q4C52_05645 [Eubacteriales bacterium]|nr:hypothetical protein [Eubacteriales bacterium]